MSAIVGPTLGGLFAQYWSWRGIFWLNIPLGVAAMWMLQRHLHERVVQRRHRIDVAGAVVLTIALSALILALLEGGVSWSWESAQSVLLFAAAATLLLAFVPIERGAAEPILPLWVFRPRILVSTNLAGFVIGAILIGLTSYVPTFAQRVVGVGAVVAGLAMGAMTFGWPIAATLSPRVYLRIGYRNTALLGGSFTTLGCLLFALFVHEDSGIWRVAVASFVTGIGLGFSSVSTVVSAQSVVGWNRRGVVTGTNMFIRSLGSAVGVAVFGSIVNSRLHGGSSLYEAVHAVFWALVVVAALGLAAQQWMPRRVEPLVFADDAGGWDDGERAEPALDPLDATAD
jgi:MFS family permease